MNEMQEYDSQEKLFHCPEFYLWEIKTGEKTNQIASILFVLGYCKCSNHLRTTWLE